MLQLHPTAQIHQHAPKHVSKNQRPRVQLQEGESGRPVSLMSESFLVTLASLNDNVVQIHHDPQNASGFSSKASLFQQGLSQHLPRSLELGSSCRLYRPLQMSRLAVVRYSLAFPVPSRVSCAVASSLQSSPGFLYQMYIRLPKATWPRVHFALPALQASLGLAETVCSCCCCCWVREGIMISEQ